MTMTTTRMTTTTTPTPLLSKTHTSPLDLLSEVSKIVQNVNNSLLWCVISRRPLFDTALTLFSDQIYHGCGTTSRILMS